MRYVALLRGVSPVNAPNAKLTELFKKLELTSVQTVGSSGNVLFSTHETDMTKLETRIEQALNDLLGANALAIVLSVDQIKSLVGSTPFGERKHAQASYLAVTFFKHSPRDIISDQYAVSYETYANALCTVNDNTVKPSFMARLEREYGKEITTRTWDVILKIADRLG